MQEPAKGPLRRCRSCGRMTEPVSDFLASTPRTTDEITEAFWQACNGGQRRLAQVLLAQAADINGHPDYTEQSPLQAAESADTRRGVLADWLREQGAIASKHEGPLMQSDRDDLPADMLMCLDFSGPGRRGF
jgi:hypothetical protein